MVCCLLCVDVFLIFLFVAFCGVLFDAFCLLFVGRYLMFVVRCMLFAVVWVFVCMLLVVGCLVCC